MALAPLVAGHYWNLGSGLPAPSEGQSQPGVPFLQNQFAAARLIVEVAWGADVQTDPGTWAWTDITTDVRQADGIQITIGRSDEASTSQPATCTFRVDNREGGYSQGGQSKNYPNVKRNVPVRVRVDLGQGPYTRFFGYATGIVPSWDVTGENAEAVFTANGVLRRLIQGIPKVESLMKKLLSADPTTVGYWPCEDLKDSLSIASGLPENEPMFFSGTVNFASDDTFDSSDPFLEINNADLFAPMPIYEDTAETFIQWLSTTPSSGFDDVYFFSIACSGSCNRLELQMKAGGVLKLDAWDIDNNQILNGANVSFDAYGKTRRWFIEITETGGDIHIEYGLQPINAAPGGSAATAEDITSETIGRITSIQVGRFNNVSGLSIGHLTVQTEIPSIYADATVLQAFNGEQVTSQLDATSGRIRRLCEEHNIPLNLISADGGRNSTASTRSGYMGPQAVDSVVNLLRDAEAVEQGILFDGLNTGLTYITRYARENRAPTMVIDASSGDLVMPFAPTDDDQTTRNISTVTKRNASSFTYEDDDGPMGTAVIGVYDESQTINMHRDSDAAHFASWFVHHGTIQGYRYPTLALNLAKSPHLFNSDGSAPLYPDDELYPSTALYPNDGSVIEAGGWMAVTPGHRIDIVNLNTARTQVPDETVSLLVQGWTETISQFVWDVNVNCTPYEPWQLIELASDSGDANPYIAHLQTDGSTLAASAAAGATSLSVATTSGPLWTTTTDDFPFDISLAGRRVTVTAISGASSPQTFTVDAIPVAAPAGVEIAVWDPPSIGL